VAWRFQENFGKLSRVDVHDPTDPATWGTRVDSVFPFTGEPMGLEVAYSATGQKVYAYVTSVSCHGEDGGLGPMAAGPQFWCEEDCAGGGPPPPRRVLYLTVLDVTDPANMTEVVRHEIAATEPPCSERPALENVGLALSGDGSRLLVANPDGDELVVVRTSYFVVESRIELSPGSQPVDVAVVQPGGTGSELAYVVGHGDHVLYVVNTSTIQAVVDLAAPGDPDVALLKPVAVAARSDGKRVFTADNLHETITVVNIDPTIGLPRRWNEIYPGGPARRLVLLDVPH
jgi:hypothetical protein